jgi:hypothetical protein
MTPFPERFQSWIDVRKRHKLSHAHVQMARELGMNPTKLGKLDNASQERWKTPLPAFIEELYFKRFGKERPDVVRSIEELVNATKQKRSAKREARPRCEGDAATQLDNGHDEIVGR